MERKEDRVAERQWMVSEPGSDNIQLSYKLVELVLQIAASMDLMERLVMGVDRIGRNLEVMAERMGEKKEKEKERKDAEMQTEELTEDEEVETDGEEAEEEKEDEIGEEGMEKENEEK